MEILILINGKGKRYTVDKPINCSDKDMIEWLYSELEEREIKQGNRLEGFILGRLRYICDLKRKR